VRLSDKSIVEENVHVTCRRCERGWQGEGARSFVEKHLEGCTRYEQLPRGKRSAPEHIVVLELPKGAAADGFEAWYAPPQPEPEPSA
jgi:hypothetical protein